MIWTPRVGVAATTAHLDEQRAKYFPLGNDDAWLASVRAGRRDRFASFYSDRPCFSSED
ncbi:hypothetical protein ACSNOI_06955 [Actinomadura kijaniata]|uniref:hypothetical protein n=1 Tax=Actinomadura kijaniata TaxID=46161 RepID=UPI003F1942E2